MRYSSCTYMSLGKDKTSPVPNKFELVIPKQRYKKRRLNMQLKCSTKTKNKDISQQIKNRHKKRRGDSGLTSGSTREEGNLGGEPCGQSDNSDMLQQKQPPYQ